MTFEIFGVKITSYRLWRMGVRIVRLYYLDESAGKTRYVRSAIGIDVSVWSETFLKIQEWRKELWDRYNIPLFKELHATDLLGGRGHLVRKGRQYYGISKKIGAEIFISGLNCLERMAEMLSGIEIINVSLERKKGVDGESLNRMLNRINSSVKPKLYAFLIFDEGKEVLVTRAYRKARVFNPIVSKFGKWEKGERWKNIPIENIVGGPAFRSSKSDYFLQMADFVAHALLKKDEKPAIPRVKYYGIDKAFDILDKSLNKKASEDDPQGVVRH